MSSDQMIRIYLMFTAARTYECLIPSGMMLADAADEVCRLAGSQLGDFYEYNKHSLIYEKNSGILCDPHVSVNSLGAVDGMIFEIY